MRYLTVTLMFCTMSRWLPVTHRRSRRNSRWPPRGQTAARGRLRRRVR
jgi:hypothetical protein